MRTTRNVKLLGLTSLFNDIASDATLRLLPLFLANVLGASTGIIGLIEGVAESTATLTKLLSGWLSDHLPRRKPLVVAGYAISGFTKPFLLIANHWSWVLFVRFADRFGKGMRSAPRDALIADDAHEKNRGHSFGLNRALDTLGGIIGLSAAYFILQNVNSGSAHPLTREAYRVVVLVALVPATLAVAIVAFGVREARRARAAIHLHKMGPKTDVTRDLDALPPIFWRYIAIMGIFMLANSSDAFLVLKAAGKSSNTGLVLLCLIALNISSTALALPAGRLSDTLGRKRLILVGWTLYALAYAGFGLLSAPGPLALLGLFALYGAYYGVSEGTERAFIADLVARKRGTAYGIFNFVAGVMVFPASLLFGLGIERFGERAAFLCAAGLAAAAAVALALFISEKRA